ncbi:MAG: enoyl-CoA hydratase/isomerase family protein [Desulfobacterales bacterium]|nr:MAG: enoyl-CoA hydratase/isomerase family protein [Desulfobacterales bacterium]
MVLLYEKKEKIATITLNRPKVLNAINLELAAELYRAWIDFSQDPKMVVLIITGSGNDAFCVGDDLKERTQKGQDMHVSNFWDSSVKLPMRDAECHKPVVAAINGHCLAGGLELALMADIRIASKNATFGQPEINWGIFPGMGATQRLPRVLPHNLAAEILLTGKRIEAQRAFEIGLVNHVVPLKDLMKTAGAMAEDISKKAPLALRAVKEALQRSYDLPLDQGLRLEALLRRIIGDTADALEGMHAFQESRKPEFKGK